MKQANKRIFQVIFEKTVIILVTSLTKYNTQMEMI